MIKNLLQKVGSAFDSKGHDHDCCGGNHSHGSSPNRKGFTFLICGAGRGGTSLLTGMLDSHESLEVAFEHASVACLMGQEVKTRGSKLFQDRAETFLKECKKEAARFPNKLYGNKITTEQLIGLNDHNTENPTAQIDVLDSFFNHYMAGVKVIFILRDGRTCVRSKIARTGQPVELACDRWNYSVEVYKFFMNRHTNNIRIRYEDLLASPEPTLRQVTDFLGVEFQPALLKGTDSEKIPQEYRRVGLDTTKLALDDFPPACLERISSGLRFCGYLDNDVQASGKLAAS